MDNTLIPLLNESVDTKRYEALESRMSKMEESLKENTQLTKNISDFLRNANAFASFLKWTAGVGAALLFFWNLFLQIKGGK